MRLARHREQPHQAGSGLTRRDAVRDHAHEPRHRNDAVGRVRQRCRPIVDVDRTLRMRRSRRRNSEHYDRRKQEQSAHPRIQARGPPRLVPQWSPARTGGPNVRSGDRPARRAGPFLGDDDHEIDDRILEVGVDADVGHGRRERLLDARRTARSLPGARASSRERAARAVRSVNRPARTCRFTSPSAWRRRDQYRLAHRAGSSSRPAGT